jgi:bacillithiol biosynthesis deacetylase BshB1
VTGSHPPVLAVGTHPDDVELFCGGTVALLADRGLPVVIADLTRGEMASRGSPAEREEEAAEGARVLGACRRVNLDLGDARLVVSLENRHRLARLLREVRPAIILAPWREDPHPDHAAAGRLVEESCFDARLAGLAPDLPPFAPELVLFYPGHTYREPSLVTDVTSTFARKMEAVRAHRSQFGPGAAPRTAAPVGFDDYPWQVESRCRHYGSLVNRPYGEGFVSLRPLLASPADILPQKES